jgi:hypothetical protein
VAHPQRLITITDIDAAGGRQPVLATADPEIVAAVELAIRQRVARDIVPAPIASTP